MLNFKSRRQHVEEQIEKSPEFTAEYSKAQLETRFAVALALLREERGLTQQQLADAAGLRQPMLARYEKGQIPTVATLQRLASALEARVLISSDAIIIESLKTKHIGVRPPRPTQAKARISRKEVVPA